VSKFRTGICFLRTFRSICCCMCVPPFSWLTWFLPIIDHWHQILMPCTRTGSVRHARSLRPSDIGISHLIPPAPLMSSPSVTTECNSPITTHRAMGRDDSCQGWKEIDISNIKIYLLRTFSPRFTLWSSTLTLYGSFLDSEKA